MTAFEHLDNIDRYGGFVRLRDDGALVVRCMPDDARMVKGNVALIADALQYPDRYPCRVFASHPTDPKLPCKRCGQHWGAHPRDLMPIRPVPTF